VARLTKTDLENSISGYGEESCKLTKSSEKCQCIFACPKTSWQVESSALIVQKVQAYKSSQHKTWAKTTTHSMSGISKLDGNY
jgi:hypothetical protein